MHSSNQPHIKLQPYKDKIRRVIYYLKQLIKELISLLHVTSTSNHAIDSQIHAESPLVVFIAPVYQYYPLLIKSLQLQTYSNWLLLLIHDGPADSTFHNVLLAEKDERVLFFETAYRFNDYGHSLRQQCLEKLADGIEGDWVIITNADNYYVPKFLESMIKCASPSLVAIYCDFLSWRHGYHITQAKLEHTFIDCGAIMVRRDVALQVMWKNRELEADWLYVKEIKELYGDTHIRRVPKPLFIHN